jgi:hypothetical protein
MGYGEDDPWKMGDSIQRVSVGSTAKYAKNGRDQYELMISGGIFLP